MSERLESSIQSEIIKKLKKRKKSFTHKHCPDPVGYPDVEHLERGILFLFELKRTSKDEASKIQKYRHKKLKKAGAIVNVVWKWQQVLDILNKTLNKL
jgi:hypothetical protein